MKSIINLRHWQAILFSITFFTSFAISRQYTDPFFVPKNFFFFFSSGFFIIIMCISYYNKKNNTTLDITLIDITISVFILFSLLRILFTPGIGIDNVKFYLFFINGVIYFLIKPLLFKTSKNIKSSPVETIVNILLIISILQAFWGVLQYFHIIKNLQKEFRVGGAFGNPGQYTNFITPLLSFGLAISFFSKKYKILGIFASIAILIILPLSQARTAWIGALAVIIYMADKKFMLFKKILNFLKYPLLKIMILALIALIIVISGYFMYNLKKQSSSGRLFIWEVSLTMIKEKPLWGYGFDRYASAHNDYQATYFKEHPDDKQKSEIADGVNYAFNEFIQVTVETGIIGLILLLSIFFFAFKMKKKETGTEEENLYFYGAKGCLLVIFISMLFSYPLHTIPSLILLFFSLAMISSYSKQKLISPAIQPGTRKFFSFSGIVLSVIFLITQYGRNKAEHEWVNAYKLMRENRYDEAYKSYIDLYPTLKYNQFFLFNYGAELSLMQRYKESIEILKQTELRLNDADFYIYLGNSYENLGNISEAEQCYLKASHVMPLKFFPRYKLVNIYMKTGRNTEAIALAKNILSMPVKVPSQTIDAIKQEMQQLVNNYN